MSRSFEREGWRAGRRRVRRLMQAMGLAAIYYRPCRSEPHPGDRISPYLLRDLAVERAHQEWCADITYIPLQRRFLYQVAVMD